ncbi:lipopolysaccharide biosynthesis protein [Echinicola sp. 20G]|uniref:lipopolysaccharide biosynthesis protein n=1 Tax=Echinicola sp. 20G TaxID=2781961 RepID=UPI0019109594|nr:hypothetical protein [Echinicola sp. 20G]
MSKLISVMVDQGIMSLATFFTTVVLARNVSKNDYANFVLLVSITLFILGIQSALISKPFAINQNDFGKHRVQQYRNYTYLFKLFFTLGLVLTIPVLYLLDHGFDSDLFALGIFYILAYLSYYFLREMLLSERKTKDNLICGLFGGGGILLFLLFFFLSGNTSLNLFLMGSSLIYLVISGVFYLKNYQKVKVELRWIKYFKKVNWKVGKWLLGSNLFFHIANQVYPWLLLILSRKEDIATVGILMSIASLINPILTALSAYLLPIFVRSNKEIGKIKELTKKWTLIFFIMALILVLIGLGMGNNIVQWFFSEKYAGLGFVVFLPFINQAINILFQPIKVAMNAVKRTDVAFQLLVMRSVVAVLLGYYLVLNYGVLGVFMTKIIENIIYNGFQVYWFNKLLNGNMPKLS